MLRSLASVVLSAGLFVPLQLYAQQQKDTNAPPANSDSRTKDQAAPHKKSSNAEDNPFPEDISRKAADAAKQQESTPKPDAAQPSGESSSASRYSDAGFDDNDRDTEKGNKPGDTPMPATGRDTQRALKDDQVGKFYLDRGDWKGAYNRFKDALAFEPEDAEAAFGLAEAASKLNLTGEAVANYQKYLELDPDGPRAKASVKALRNLQSSEKESSRK
jgi:tetratricopeptide (TPR) repeat protein